MPASLLGMGAAGIVVVVAAVSARYVRRRLRYEVWHGLHLLLYVALGLAFAWPLGQYLGALAAIRGWKSLRSRTV